ncbi:hypothetical protein Tco_0067660 [Tanacetum coccineum]
MENVRHKEVLKSSTYKEVGPSASDADHGDSRSSSSSEDLNFRGFMDEETKVLSSMISRQELEEFRKGGIMKDFRNEMFTYHDFKACDVPKFDGILNSVASARWLSAIEGAFRTSCCKGIIKSILPQTFFVIMLRYGGMKRVVRMVRNG